MKQTFTHEINNIVLLYSLKDDLMNLTIVPKSKKDDYLENRIFKDDWKQYFGFDPMIQIAKSSDSVKRDLSAGMTLFNSTTSFDLKFYNQLVIENDEFKEIRTYFKTEYGLNVINHIRGVKGYNAIEEWNEIEAEKEVVLENVSSFMISSLSPFLNKNDEENKIYTILNYWSEEGKLVSTRCKDLSFIDSWSALGTKTYRIGSVGSMPSRGYIPFMGFLDSINNVCWAVSLEAHSSWQIEAVHRYGSVSLVGGVADYLYGHFKKKLLPNEKFTTPKAYITVSTEGIDDACSKLTRYHDTLLKVEEEEENLPIVYNEYLHSWGNPTIENIKPQLKIAKDIGCDYFVIDAGWFSLKGESTLGDWNERLDKFPNGLKEFSTEVEKYGFKKYGLWYELEAVTKDSELYKNHKDWVLTIDGCEIVRENRMFLDFRKEEVKEYLREKIIKKLNDNNLSYLKLDYNENIGLGIDGQDSYGANLKEHMDNVYNFIKEIRDSVKGLILENCSCGGMRHEISFLNIGSMTSFSDAHEEKFAAIIASSLHRVMQPRVMQIWVSILPTLTIDEVYLKFVTGMLGRICISGDLENVSDDVITISKSGIKFYNLIKDVIKYGKTILIDTNDFDSLNDLHGILKLVRVSDDERKMVCYCFGYNKVDKAKFDVDGYHLVTSFGNVNITNDGVVDVSKNNSAIVAIFERNK